MKKIVLAIAIVLGLASCNSSSKQENNTAVEQQSTVETNVMSVDDMLASAEKYVGKEVTFKGVVAHTCKHAGKRCFIQGETPDLSIRVEAKGDIGGFNRELIGNEIEVTGTLKERRVSNTQIDDMEKALATQSFKDDGSQESCDTEKANIQGMRDWMKTNDKDYFAIYYVDGTSYNEL